MRANCIRWIAVVLLSITLATAAEQESLSQSNECGCRKNECPEINEEYVTFFAHDTDCDKFCMCDWGVAYVRPCPAGLHFNTDLNVCDWPWDAGCTLTNEGDDSGVCPEDGGSVSNEVDVDDESDEVSAGEESNEVETGDSAEENTDPDEGDCGSDDNQNNDNSGCAGGTCPAQNGAEPVFFPHDSDCGRYCMCDWGVAYGMDCPAGLHFNSALNVCDWPNNAGCDGSDGNDNGGGDDNNSGDGNGDDNGSSDGNGDENGSNGDNGDGNGGDGGDGDDGNSNGGDGSAGCSNAVCPAENGAYPEFFPHDSDCGRYCVCDWGVAIEMSCPDGLHFNTNLNVCDWPENAGCDGAGGSDNGGGDDGDGDDGNSEDNGSSEDNGDGNGSDETNGDGDDNGNGDDGDGSAGCSNAVCTAENGAYPEFFPHDSDCGRYCVCDWGIAIEMSCPDGLHFNTNLNVCDWPENAGCDGAGGSDNGGGDVGDGDDGNGEDNGSSEDNGDGNGSDESNGDGDDNGNGDDGDGSAGCSNAVCPAENGAYPEFFPHDSDCGRYCVCDWGVAIEMSCPDGLHFNTNLNVCDWPENAGCDGAGGSDNGGGDDGDGDDGNSEDNGSSEDNGDGNGSDETNGDGDDNGNGDDGDGSAGCSNAVCPAENGAYPEFFPHDSDCGRYCVCDWGVAIEMSCPDGLHFNTNLNVCDWPENAGCDGAGGSDNGGGDVGDGDDGNGEDNGSSEDNGDGNGSDESNGDGDDNGNGDDGDGSAGCSNAVCPAENGAYPEFFPHDSDCGRYCVCDWGVAIEMSCPDGLHFNTNLNVCDWPENAGCDGAGGSDNGGGDDGDGDDGNSEDNGSSEDNGDGNGSDETNGDGDDNGNGDDGDGSAGCSNAVCPAENGAYPEFFPHDSDCGRYCVCDWGVAIEMSCPDGLHFNTNLNVCDWPENAGCDGAGGSDNGGGDVGDGDDGNGEDNGSSEDNGDGNGSDESNGDGDDNGNGDDGDGSAGCSNAVCPAENGAYPEFFPHDSDCGRYCVCDWGVAIEMSCPDGLHFNTNLNVCDWPENAGCDGAGGSDNGGGDGGDGDDGNGEDNGSSEDNGDGNGSDESNGDGDDNGNGNDGDGSAGCSNAVCPAENGAYPEFFPHDSDCGRYCVCDWGVAIEMSCPDGLHFNTNLNVCDWPENAGCDGAGGSDGGDGDDDNGEDNGSSEDNGEGNGSDENNGGGDDNGDDSGNGDAEAGTGGCSDVECPAENGAFPVFFAHHTDCGRYCKCDWGVAYDMPCPDGLHFNVNLNVCDYPQDADCSI